MGNSVQGTCLKAVIVFAIQKKEHTSALTWKWFVVPFSHLNLYLTTVKRWEKTDLEVQWKDDRL